MKRRTVPFSRDRGAVLVLVAIGMIALIAMLGVVLDLGYLYIRKTELQNAADAAALSGARNLDGTSGGIDAALAAAIATAGANASDFSTTPVSITAANVGFGQTPDGPWSDAVNAKLPANVANEWFIKVDTSGIAQGTRPTWVMAAVSTAFASTTTSGYAVAGRTLCGTLPIFGCVQTTNPITGAPLPPPTAANDYNFVKGQAYWFAQSSSGSPIGQGDIGWMDPVPPGAPSLISGTSDLREVLCRGRGYCLSPGSYSSLTQSAFSPTADALNTRFDVYKSPLNDATHMQQCPADTNVKEYVWNDNGAGSPKKWLAAAPGEQSEDDLSTPPGVHWSSVRPTAGATPAISGTYPGIGTPYSQSGGSFWQGPKNSTAPQPGRRILSLGLADNCATINGSGKPVNIVAFGQFVMQRQASGTGPNKGFYAEFIRTLTSSPASIPDIKLVR